MEISKMAKLWQNCAIEGYRLKISRIFKKNKIL